MAIGNGVRGQINDELESIGSGMVELYLDTTLETTTIRFFDDFNRHDQNLFRHIGMYCHLGLYTEKNAGIRIFNLNFHTVSKQILTE